MMTDYQERDSTLASMGYASYAAYLESGLWKGIRLYVLARDNRICCKCGNPAGQVHHSSYSISVLKGNDSSRLHSVCGTCHDAAEKTPSGGKRSLAQVNAILMSPSRFMIPSSGTLPTQTIPLKGRWIKLICPCGNECKKGRSLCNKCRPKRPNQNLPTPKKSARKKDSRDPKPARAKVPGRQPPLIIDGIPRRIYMH